MAPEWDYDRRVKEGDFGDANFVTTKELRANLAEIVNRVAFGVRNYMQNEAGFKEVMAAANLSGKALQNLALWSGNAATAKIELEQVKMTAVAKANAALRDAGLMIGPDGSVQPIPTA